MRAYAWVCRTFIWPWSRHHRCSVCGLPRAVWMRGDHTNCILYEVERTRREERKRLQQERPA